MRITHVNDWEIGREILEQLGRDPTSQEPCRSFGPRQQQCIRVSQTRERVLARQEPGHIDVRPQAVALELGDHGRIRLADETDKRRQLRSSLEELTYSHPRRCYVVPARV